MLVQVSKWSSGRGETSGCRGCSSWALDHTRSTMSIRPPVGPRRQVSGWRADRLHRVPSGAMRGRARLRVEARPGIAQPRCRRDTLNRSVPPSSHPDSYPHAHAASARDKPPSARTPSRRGNPNGTAPRGGKPSGLRKPRCGAERGTIHERRPRMGGSCDLLAVCWAT
jgi:hypothetical protein